MTTSTKSELKAVQQGIQSAVSKIGKAEAALKDWAELEESLNQKILEYSREANPRDENAAAKAGGYRSQLEIIPHRRAKDEQSLKLAQAELEDQLQQACDLIAAASRVQLDSLVDQIAGAIRPFGTDRQAKEVANAAVPILDVTIAAYSQLHDYTHAQYWGLQFKLPKVAKKLEELLSR